MQPKAIFSTVLRLAQSFNRLQWIIIILAHLFILQVLLAIWCCFPRSDSAVISVFVNESYPIQTHIHTPSKLSVRYANATHNHSIPHELQSVLSLDVRSVKNARSTVHAASSQVSWSDSAYLRSHPPNNHILSQISSNPSFATVDLRPHSIWRQAESDPNFGVDAHTLGCAVHTSTAVDGLIHIKPDTKVIPSSCHICFQLSNPSLFDTMLQGVRLTTPTTGCYVGKSSVHQRHAGWQANELQKKTLTDFTAFPWSVDCAFPNGIPALTCNALNKLYEEIPYDDDIQEIYVVTNFTLSTAGSNLDFHVSTRYPWGSFPKSGDDDAIRYEIWNSKRPSFSSDYLHHPLIPKSADEMKMVFVEGPVYSFERQAAFLRSTRTSSTGGVHPRLTTNLLHQASLAPISTRVIGVLDGQFYATSVYLQSQLRKRIRDFITSPTDDFLPPGTTDEMTLSQVLERRRVSVVIVSLPSTEFSTSQLVMAGQYAFASYVVARYSAFYHAMFYLDGDSTLMKGPESQVTLRQMVYSHLFERGCVDGLFKLVEQAVPVEFSDESHVFKCVARLASDTREWERVTTGDTCRRDTGNMVMRTDSGMSMDVHWVSSSTAAFGTLGNCTVDFKTRERFTLNERDFVQLHLTRKRRSSTCTCFGKK